MRNVVLFLLLFTFRLSLRRRKKRSSTKKKNESTFSTMATCAVYDFILWLLLLKLLSCIFMDENQLAKISTVFGKIISLQRELWKIGSSGSHDKANTRDEFQGFLLFSWSCYANNIRRKNIAIELDGSDDKFAFSEAIRRSTFQNMHPNISHLLNRLI